MPTTLLETPPLRQATAEEFRAALVAVQSPTKRLDSMSRESLRLEAIDFLAMLPQLYSLDDPMRVWEYVAKAVDAAGQTVRDDDVIQWSSMILETLKCPGHVAACHEGWGRFQELAHARPAEWRQQFIAYTSRSLAALLPLARDKHKQRQAERSAARAQKKGAAA